MPRAARSASPQTGNVLDDLRVLQDRVVARIRELEPYEQELQQLRTEAQRLGLDPTAEGASGAAARENAPNGGRRSRANASAKPRRRARRVDGQSRADQILAFVREQPGATVADVSRSFGVAASGLYGPVRALEADGRLRKVGRQLQPMGEGVASEPAEAPSA